MDYMYQERTRGITIRSAAITFNWSGFQFNLIDTPGHVDFSGEVERSLRVMDGSVVVVDAANGVQTQTQTVWRQSDKFHIPRLVFLNKMDLHAASIEVPLQDLEKKLNAVPLLVQVPLPGLAGVVDLLSMQPILYKDALGTEAVLGNLSELPEAVQTLAKERREALLDTVASLDQEFLDKLVDGKYTQEDILLAIRKLTVRLKGFPTFVGSALKNRGVQPLLDGVVRYLPSPAEVKAAKGTFRGQILERTPEDKHLCALAYKVIHNSSRGNLVYARIYSGKIKQGESLKNTTQNGLTEKATQLLRVRSNEYVEVNSVTAGDIVAIVGLKKACSGDTLVARSDSEEIKLPGVEMPPPVFFCNIEAENEREQKELEDLLEALSREDPSFTAKKDQESGQLLVTGQGELHLEILRDRLEIEFGMKTRLGSMMVAYREAASSEQAHQIMIDRKELNQFLCLHLKVVPEENQIDIEDVESALHGDRFSELLGKVEWNLKDSSSSVYYSYISQFESKGETEEFMPIHKLNPEAKEKLIEELKNSVQRGPVLGYPLINLKLVVEDGIISRKRTSQSVINEAVAKGVRELVEKADPRLMEPIMQTEITVPDSIIGDLIGDLTSNRRGMIMEVKKDTFEGKSTVVARVPLKEMLGYSSMLRSISKGEGVFIMKFQSYEVVPDVVFQEMFSFH